MGFDLEYCDDVVCRCGLKENVVELLGIIIVNLEISLIIMIGCDPIGLTL